MRELGVVGADGFHVLVHLGVALLKIERQLDHELGQPLLVVLLLFGVLPGTHQAAEAAALRNQTEVDELSAGGQHQRQAAAGDQGEGAQAQQADPVVLPGQRLFNVAGGGVLELVELAGAFREVGHRFRKSFAARGRRWSSPPTRRRAPD